MKTILIYLYGIKLLRFDGMLFLCQPEVHEGSFHSNYYYEVYLC